jgi:hypothetical protein
MKAEELYVRLYEDFTPTAEYLQADSEHRNFLPETMILAGLAFALGAFVQSFLGALGKATAEGITARVGAAFEKSEKTGDRNAMLDGLALLGPYLQHLSKMSNSQRKVYIDAIAAALADRGYPDDVARQTASELVTSLTEASEE